MPELRSFRRLFLWGVWLILFTSVACAQDASVARPVMVEQPTETALPTPTLAPNVPTPPPDSIFPSLENEELAEGSLQLEQAAPVPTVTPLPTSTPPPLPGERLFLAQNALHNGDYQQVITLLRDAQLPAQQRMEGEELLGVAYLRDGQFAVARTYFSDLISARGADSIAVDSFFYLAEAAAALGEWPVAIEAYQVVQNRHPELGAIIQQRIAAAYRGLGETENARMALEAALTAPANRLTLIDIHQELAALSMAAEDFMTAVLHYDAIHALAVTEFTRGQTTYFAGNAAQQAGDFELAVARFQRGVNRYPGAYESYLGLVELVEAGVPVDDFQRGLVNFNAGAYDPAIAAFERHLAANPGDPPTYLYLARCYESVANLAAAADALDRYAQTFPGEAALLRAQLLRRRGDLQGALAIFEDAAASFSGPVGAEASFAAAEITAELDSVAAAVLRYEAVADGFPESGGAPAALFRAGWLAYSVMGDVETAVPLWLRAVRDYPQTEPAMEAAVWLQRVLVDDVPALEADIDAESLIDETRQIIGNVQNIKYFTLRARALADQQPPFVGRYPFAIPSAGEQALLQQEAEDWLRDRLSLSADEEIGDLSPQLAQEPGILLGTQLWEWGLFAEAKRELEDVRTSYRENTLASYQLALYFRELGLYRSSILAAERVLILQNETVFTAPRFLGQLAYPVYYADLILPLAAEYAYDPRLQFSLVRQESLFESFATSGAAAQGLSQVIPDTGAYIAGLLVWPDYENIDLYKPYVGLTFGAFYLRQQLDFFDGDVHAALSAYNAGPGNAARWHETAGSDLDLYVETVNFPETRLYIERIYTGFVIYEYLYQAASGASE